MVKLTVTHEDGSVHEYENVVAFDFYDYDFCCNVAGKELSDKEISDIEKELDGETEITSDVVSGIVNSNIQEA